MMKRFFFKRRTWLFLAIFTSLVIFASFASSGSSFVLKSYTLSQVKPQSFKFNIDGGQPLHFSYDANTTVIMTLYLVASDGSKTFEREIKNSSYSFDEIRSASWTCNITLYTFGAKGASVNVRYTYMKTTGIDLSISIAIVAAAMAVFFIWLLVSKRKGAEPPRNESKQAGDETDG
ncbi:MAG TPA: hypothetical protein VKM55_15860 [Candidatus Lokiarchaeia archaeon]|nr:hypothetical protein [Candidatus Lokiarchaeia archaeon]